jgi:hypothetical protein
MAADHFGSIRPIYILDLGFRVNRLIGLKIGL